MIVYKYGNHDATLKKKLLKISHGFMADTTDYGRQNQLMLTVKPVVARILTSMNVLAGSKIFTCFPGMASLHPAETYQIPVATSLNVYRLYP